MIDVLQPLKVGNSHTTSIQVHILLNKTKILRNKRFQSSELLISFLRVSNYYREIRVRNDSLLNNLIRYWQRRGHCCGHIVAHDVSWAAQTGKHLLRTQCFWTKSETFFASRTQNLCPQQMLRARANGETFVSATMCPRLPGPIAKIWYLKLTGMTSLLFSIKTFSAAGVVGPFAPSAITWNKMQI